MDNKLKNTIRNMALESLITDLKNFIDKVNDSDWAFLNLESDQQKTLLKQANLIKLFAKDLETMKQ